jgi:protein TonB
VFALSTTLVAFEWRVPKQSIAHFSTEWEDPAIIEEIPITTRKKAKLPKPKLKNPVVSPDPEPRTEPTVVDPNNTSSDKNLAIDPSIFDGWMDDSVEVEIDTIVEFAEFRPEFPGGDAALMNYLAKNIRYTRWAAERGIEGWVGISFVIETDGSITDIQLDRSLDSDLDGIALKAVKNMPEWKPGMHHGKYVRYRYRLPVRFKLN